MVMSEIETLFGHVKGEWPHLEKIRDPGEVRLCDLDGRLHGALVCGYPAIRYAMAFMVCPPLALPACTFCASKVAVQVRAIQSSQVWNVPPSTARTSLM